MLYRKHNILSGERLELAQKKREAIRESLKGEQGEQGPAGADGVGIAGAVGKQGYKGPRGLQGESGRDGARGPMGPPGRDGVNGTNGKDGKDGEDGRGIKKAYINNGYLHIVYTDGEDVNLGSVVGPRGASGKHGGTLAQFDNLSVFDKTVSGSHVITNNIYIRQTVADITTTLTGGQAGDKFYVKNTSTGTTTLSATIDGYSSVELQENESLTLVYNGSGFDIV